MRLLLTGGGTAGHINPALAIAETVLQNDPGAVIEFVGVQNGKEADLVPREGYKLHFVRSMGIRRSLSPSNFKAIYLAITSPRAPETQKILDDFQPDLVIGTGGFASWPIMKAAADRGIPTAVHESNAKVGLTVKALQKCVDRIWLNFPQSIRQLSRSAQKRATCVGNPLRAGFGSLPQAEAKRRMGLGEDEQLLLAFGGSLGAEEVNRAVLNVMKETAEKYPNLTQILASGKRDYEAMKLLFDKAELPARCWLVDYIYEMPLYMSAADLVISRAGAMTLSELSRMQKAAVLIPSPNVTDNHQFKNAKALADESAAILVEEKEFACGALTKAVDRLLADAEEREKLRTQIAAFSRHDANRLIWDEIQRMTQKS